MCTVRIQGGIREVARTLGILRPSRLLPKFLPEHLGRLTCDKGLLDTVASITPLGDLEVVMVDVENNLLLVKGAVPGAKNGYVVVKPAVKK